MHHVCPPCSWSPERPAALLAIGLAVWWAKKQRSKKAVDSTGAAIAASGDAAAVGSPHSTALQAIATDTSSSGVQAQGQGTESQETAEGQGQEAVGEASAAPLAVALAQRLTEQLQEKVKTSSCPICAVCCLVLSPFDCETQCVCVQAESSMPCYLATP